MERNMVMIKRNFFKSLAFAGTFLLHLSLLCNQTRSATNDAFSNAQLLTGASGTVSGDNIGATKHPSETYHADNQGGSSIWFRWTAPSTGQFFFNTLGSNFDTLLAVYTGNTLNHLTAVASNDEVNSTHASAVTILATSGTTYQVAVDGYE